MIVEVTELVRSRNVSITGSGVTSERVFHAETADPEDAYKHLPEYLQYGYSHPDPDMKLIVIDVNIKPLLIRDKDSSSLCLVTVTYGLPTMDNRTNDDGEIWEWSLTSQQNHITSVTSKSRQRSFPAIQDAGTAIGVQGDEVKGVSVYQPTQRLRVTKEYEGVDMGLRRHIKEAVAHTNRGTFGAAGGTMGSQAGEVLFLGAEISPISTTMLTPRETRWRVSYEFLIAKNPGTILIRSIWNTLIEVTDVKAWDYIWYKHGKRLITPFGGRKMWKVGIESIHVAQVYDSYDFSSLGLKGGP